MFADRVDAGRRLARSLWRFRGEDLVVLGLPRGGVPVAAEVARLLDAPLDVVLVRKLGVPMQPELAMGAVAEGEVRILDRDLVARLGIRPDEVGAVEEREREILSRRVEVLRRGREPVDLHGRTAIVVDDGIATGSTARVACHVARERGARRVVLAVPVGPRDTLRRVPEADEVIIESTPHPFIAVGNHYRDFTPTTDRDVVDLLDAAREARDRNHVESHGEGVDREIVVTSGGVHLGARLTIPQHASGVVVFAHGSGSSRHSPRNRYVASVLNRSGIGTLLLDLLTAREERDRANVFDIPLLAGRLVSVTEWLSREPLTASLSIGYFGASTGAGAALYAAARVGDAVRAVVSRGGRPDLAAERLRDVQAPTLLVVGGQDETVLALNEAARARMRCPTELRIVPGATHLFEEPGALEQVADMSADWFLRHLSTTAYHHTHTKAG